MYVYKLIANGRNKCMKGSKKLNELLEDNQKKLKNYLSTIIKRLWRLHQRIEKKLRISLVSM